ncbi:hypothetical protein [Bradyrhizobium sp. 2S1]|nr:hypothetical protein [Bradyrhizobium sp. 2S1]MCK7670931.1 hypothetical protein [Bradyrhizobium sp. 2S1]
MSFFSEAELDQIKDDPTTVLDLYDAESARFIAALNMPGLSDAAYKSAFW